MSEKSMNLEELKQLIKSKVFVKYFISPKDQKKYEQQEYIPLRRILLAIVNKLGRNFELRLLSIRGIKDQKIFKVKVLKHQVSKKIKGLNENIILDKAFEDIVIEAKEKILSMDKPGEFQIPKIYKQDKEGKIREITEIDNVDYDIVVHKDIIDKIFLINREVAKQYNLLRRKWPRQLYNFLIKA